MPVMHTSHFRVRYYECDAYGHFNHANYVRLMQEAAFEAAAAVGYSKARYEALGYLWLARETEVEYLQPLHYGDEVEITTWAADFRHVRSIRKYEFRRRGAQEIIARASTDWVYMARESRRVAVIPPEMVAAFAGDNPPQTVARPPFPKAPPAPPGVFALRKRVEWRDIDGAGHMNNAAYLNHVEDCSVQVGRHFGWSVEEYIRRGVGIVTRGHRIRYLQPALLDDELEIRTWLYGIRRFSGVRHSEITRVSDGALLAQVATHWIWVDLSSGRPLRVPDALLANFAPNIAPDSPG
jgi:acyl-CoA thioester hydrolase